MDKKKILLIGSIVIILASVIASIYIISTKEEEPEYTIDGIDLPENKNILKDSTVENLKITSASLLTRDGISTYTAQVSNNTETNIDIDSLYVVFYEGEKENKILALKDSTITANNKTYINITSETDLSKTTKIEYVLENNDEVE